MDVPSQSRPLVRRLVVEHVGDDTEVPSSLEFVGASVTYEQEQAFGRCHTQAIHGCLVEVCIWFADAQSSSRSSNHCRTRLAISS